MSAKEQVGRLQLLLERVQMRAAAPRGNGAAAPVAKAHAAPAPQPQAYSEPDRDDSYDDKTDHTRTAPPPTPMLNAASEHPSFPSEHPAELAPVTVAGTEQSYDIDTDSDVEVSSEVVEVDIDIDEPMPMESGAQPVGYQTAPPAGYELEETEDQPMQTQPSNRPPLDETQEMRASEPDVSASASPANEIEEPSPSSSRRPIAGEEAQAGTYEDESAPRHTPPPESGKQVAVAPSVHPKPSAPPPSLEGHTLVGGWREPGLGGPVIGAPGIGVRVPPPPGQAAHDAAAFAAAAAPPAAPAPPQASGPRLTADVTRPAPSVAGAKVASFQNPAPVPKPATLGDLLDLTLSL